MRKIRALQEQVKNLEERTKRFGAAIWKLEHPPRFSIGDEVEYKSGQTDGIFIKAKIVDMRNMGAYWQYILWVYSLNRLHKYDGDATFYDNKYVQIRKYAQDTDATDEA